LSCGVRHFHIISTFPGPYPCTTPHLCDLYCEPFNSLSVRPSPLMTPSPKNNNLATLSAFQRKIRNYSANFFSSAFSPTFASSTHLPFSFGATAALAKDFIDDDPALTPDPALSLSDATSIQTPLRHSVSSSSFFISTPISSSAAVADLLFETPKNQIKASLVLCGEGAYDWTCTVKTSNDSLDPFHELFGDRSSAPLSASPSPSTAAAASVGSLSQSKVRFVSFFKLDGDRQMEQTTEEEIFFALSQDLDMEIINELNHSHSHESSSPVTPVAPTISGEPPLSMLNHRCVSASLPSRQQQPLFSRRGGGGGTGGRKRSISVDTNGPLVLDPHAPQFANYRSPRELELLLHCSSGTVCASRKRTADREDRPIFTPASPSSSCRCHYSCSPPSESTSSRCDSALALPPSHSLGSMFGSPSSISMDSLALSQSSPPPPMKRSKSVPPALRPCPLATHLEEPALLSSCLSLPHSLSLPLPSPSRSLFSAPRNSRGRSESFTEDFALTLSSAISSPVSSDEEQQQDQQREEAPTPSRSVGAQ
jgi:hypothetical protein